MKRPYDSTVARIAGNLLSGFGYVAPEHRPQWVQRAVAMAREIVAETIRTEPSDGICPQCGRHSVPEMGAATGCLSCGWQREPRV